MSVTFRSRHVEGPNLANGNAWLLLEALGLPVESYGECSIADARRAIMRARNRDLTQFTREPVVEYGAPRTTGNVVEARPIRVMVGGLSESDLQFRIDLFAKLVADAELVGDVEISWD